MPLPSGTRLGPYEIVAPLGAGGMGEVYCARDTKLGREVALKVLPETFARDAERMARFEREAQVLASLNHPNIATLYGVEEADGLHALVMELVEGPTLADRLSSGPIPLSEALPIARQIIEALEEAHDKGVVHRDLKPANIKVREDGTVKVLDFGLAKALDNAPASSQIANSPTMSLQATRAGVILGTAAYMSPEQARGGAVDARSDIWSLGVVVLEMLTGKTVFSRATVSDTLAAVLVSDPDWTLLPAGTPAVVKRLLRRCLERDRKQRLQAIGEARLLLAAAAEEEPAVPAPRRPLAWMATAVVAVLVAVTLAFVRFRERPVAEQPLRLSVAVPGDTSVGYVELSPDGRRLALGVFRQGVGQIYLRSLDSDELQPLSGATGARTPFWSPDSRFLSFFADGKLKVMPAAGGPARVLCEQTGLGTGGTWNRNGVILFASESGHLRRVEATGGPCTPVGREAPDDDARLPVFLPDGEHFFYVRNARGSNFGDRGVYLATLAEPVGHKVLEDVSSVVYAPPADAGARAHLLFLRESTLMAQPFDAARLQPVGDPFPVVARASRSWTPPQVAASTASNGTLVYLAGRSPESQLTWFDRTGKELGRVGPRAEHVGMALSPDGKMAVARRRSSNGALWLYDLERKSESRLTESNSGAPVWWPDGSRIWFRMTGPEGPGLYERDLRAGQLRPLQKREGEDEWKAPPSDVSWDGRFLIYTDNDPKTRGDIWYVPVESGRPGEKGVKLVGTTAVESQGQLSPDGRWLAYVSDETGPYRVYVRPFPSGAQVWTVSADNGADPRWRADGKELFFFSTTTYPRETLMAAAVESDGSGGLRIRPPQKLFEVQADLIVQQANIFSYSPHPDGQRFLVNALAGAGESTVNVITDWQRAVRPGAGP